MSKELTLQEVKEIGYQLIHFKDDDIDKLIQFMEHFPRSGRAPKGMQKHKENVDFLHKMVNMYHEHGMVSPNIAAVFSHYDSKEEIDKLVNVFAPKKKVDTLVLGRITFKNRSRMSEQRFLTNGKEIFEVLRSLKGFHRLAIEKPIEIIFKKASDMKSKAVYKSIEDEIWVKEGAKLDPEERYGHLQHIIMHELGHRAEKFYGHPETFIEYQSYTTDYSKKESFGGSEAYAELFALSHWKDKYPQYEEQISKFIGQMNRQVLEMNNRMSY